MKKQLTGAQIGCGKFAWSQDLPNMAAHPDIHLKWACDISLSNAKAAAEKFNIPCVTTDYLEIINDPEVDFIKIATSHEAHLPIIEAAAAAKKHVFCEKPMAMISEEAYKIIRAVRRSGIKLCVDLADVTGDACAASEMAGTLCGSATHVLAICGKGS